MWLDVNKCECEKSSKYDRSQRLFRVNVLVHYLNKPKNSLFNKKKIDFHLFSFLSFQTNQKPDKVILCMSLEILILEIKY